MHWQMYPNHQFLHTCGTMGCCDSGGCWNSRVVPLGDGDVKDKKNLCVDPVHLPNGQHIARCMANITVKDVIRAIERYYNLNGNAKSRGVFKYDKRPTVHVDYVATDRKEPVPETGGTVEEPQGVKNAQNEENENDAPEKGAETDGQQENDVSTEDNQAQDENVGGVEPPKEEKDEQS